MPQLIFRLCEIYTNPAHFLRSGAARSPRAVPCRRWTALWNDLLFPFWPCQSITADFSPWRRCHVSCILSAPWHRYIAVGLPTSARPTPLESFTSGFGMAVSQNYLRLFLAQGGHGKRHQNCAWGRSLLLFSVVKFWSVPYLILFEKPPCFMKPDRLSAQEGTRAQPISELEGAGARICAARFACLLFVFTSRTGSRRSTSRCGFGVSCMRPLRCPPPRPGSFLLQGGRTLASEGVFM